MNRAKLVVVVLVISAAVAIPTRGAAQQQNADTDKILESVRADLRADKVAIVTEAMNLAPAEADKFWPVYRKYEAEVANLNDARIAILKDYSAKYATMTDAEAKAIVDKSFDWETSRTQLRRDYFTQFAKATSYMTAAKFFQIEHRLDLLIDLQLASEVPGLFIKSADVRAPE